MILFMLVKFVYAICDLLCYCCWHRVHVHVWYSFSLHLGSWSLPLFSLTHFPSNTMRRNIFIPAMQLFFCHLVCLVKKLDHISSRHHDLQRDQHVPTSSLLPSHYLRNESNSGTSSSSHSSLFAEQHFVRKLLITHLITTNVFCCYQSHCFL